MATDCPAQEPASSPGVEALFRLAVAGFLCELRRWFLPHVLAGVGLFLWACYFTVVVAFPAGSSFFKQISIGLLFIIYAVLSFCFSLFTACVFALRAGCVAWNDFIGGILDLVQAQIATHVSDFSKQLTKQQARHLVSGSIQEVVGAIKRQEQQVPRFVLFFCVGMLSVALRAVFRAKIIKWSGRTLQLTKLFAGRANLIGAIFLNLHFLATLLLITCYATGVFVLAANIYFVFLLK